MEEPTSTLPQSLEPEYLRLIGLATVHHSTLDYFIRMVLFTLVGIQPAIGERMTQRQNTRSLLDAVKRVAKKRDLAPELLTRLNQFISEAAKANKERNSVVHGLWAFDDAGRGMRVPPSMSSTPDLSGLPELERDRLVTLVKEYDRLISESIKVYDLLHGRSI